MPPALLFMSRAATAPLISEANVPFYFRGASSNLDPLMEKACGSTMSTLGFLGPTVPFPKACFPSGVSVLPAFPHIRHQMSSDALTVMMLLETTWDQRSHPWILRAAVSSTFQLPQAMHCM